MKRMPTLFIGHGSPMMTLEHTETTNTFKTIGENIINNYGKPVGHPRYFGPLVCRWHLYSKHRESKADL